MNEPIPPAGASQAEERFDRPWRHGDPLDLPEGPPTWKRGERAPHDFTSALAALRGLGPSDAAAALTLVPRARNEPQGQPEPDPERDARVEHDLRRKRLLYLQRWVVRTTNLRQLLDDVVRAIGDLADQGKKPTPELVARRTKLERDLVEAEERDAIQAMRPDGCWCLGAGGSDEIGILLRVEGRDVLPALRDGEDPFTRLARYCPCPEGEAERARDEATREMLTRRFLEDRAGRLLGAARIPAKYARMTLATYPDREIAGKARRWYLTHLGEMPPASRKLRSFLAIHGPNQRGKTGLAIGIQKLALERGVLSIFRTIPDLLGELRATFDKENPACHADILGALQTAPLLVLDDLGAERLTDGASWVAETLYALLNARHMEHRLTILTSNLGWSETDIVRARRRRTGATEDERAWLPTDFNPQELWEYLGERIAWRVTQSSDRLAVLGPVLDTPDELLEPLDGPADDDDDPDTW